MYVAHEYARATHTRLALALLAPSLACVQDMARAYEKIKCQEKIAT